MDYVFPSREIGHEKPEPQIFAHALGHFPDVRVRTMPVATVLVLTHRSHVKHSMLETAKLAIMMEQLLQGGMLAI